MNKANPPDNFLRLRDTPEVYSGPGSPVRVNATGDGIEFGSAVGFSSLPATPTIGSVAAVLDGATGLAWGATVTAGGGATKYLVWWNGVNWTVAGK